MKTLFERLIKEVQQNGSTEENFFVDMNLGEPQKRSAAQKLMTSTVRNLYEEGYTPAEVKGFLAFTSRCVIYQNPKSLPDQVCDC